MSEHTRYVVETARGEFVGGKRFSHREGTTDAITKFEHSRLFTRLQDAKRAAGPGEAVREVKVILV